MAVSDVPAAVKAAMAAAAFLALLGLAEYARFESAYQSQNPDPYKVAAQFPRFAGLRAAVPADAELGYISDQPPGSLAGDTLFGTAQYTLAPRILRKDASAALVIGNFTRQVDFQAVGAQQGLKMEKDFGNGVVLFKKEGR
jgi:hypothetical protein